MKSETDMNEELHNEQEQFQSMSDNSSVEDEALKDVEINLPKHYTTTPVTFPQPDAKTLQLFSMYQQNNTLIKNLKQQIARLQHLKKQSLFLQQEAPKTQIDTSVSQYFLGRQQTYQKRQLELQKLKIDIKTIDSEQVKILMAKNQNIFNLAETYFEEFRDIIDVKSYQDGLILLTEQRKKGKKKKDTNLDDSLNKMSIRSASNDSGSSMKISGIRTKKQDKGKLKYLVRFVNYRQIFSQLGDQKSMLIDKLHYIVPLTSDQVPISLSHSKQLNLILILLKNGNILSFMIGENDSSFTKDYQSSHKTDHLYSKLNQIPQAKITIDSSLDIKFCEIKQNKLYVLTSDSLLRIYHICIDGKNKFKKFIISNIIYCQVMQNDVGSIVGMSFSRTSQQELLFITSQNNLCKIDISKFRTEILYTYSEKLIDISSFYLETEDKVFFSTQNFDPIETRLIEKSKLFVKPLQNKKQYQQLNCKDKMLKICCMEKEDKVYIIKVEKHGLLKGVEQAIDSMNPQVEIIETSIE